VCRLIFGSAILFTPFNYERGKVYGIELAANYRDGNFNAYANFTASKAQGKNIVSSQYTFDPDELANIQNHWIYLDHNQTYSASAGASYLWRQATFSASAIYGSGLRAGFANTESPASYVQVDAGASSPFMLPGLGKFNARFTIINLFDRSYEIRDGTGVCVGAPQFGPRRAYYLALEKPF
jgi:outer membrane receptor protein involved in Fe transport